MSHAQVTSVANVAISAPQAHWKAPGQGLKIRFLQVWFWVCNFDILCEFCEYVMHQDGIKYSRGEEIRICYAIRWRKKIPRNLKCHFFWPDGIWHEKDLLMPTPPVCQPWCGILGKPSSIKPFARWLDSQPSQLSKHVPNNNWGKLLYLQLEPFCLQLIFIFSVR